MIDYPGLLSSNVVFGFIPLIMSILSFQGNWAIYQRVRFLLHAQNEVMNSIAKDKIIKRIVSLILY